MDNFFFSFAKPYFTCIDNGSFFRRPFWVLYLLIAVVTLLLPFAVLALCIHGGVLNFLKLGGIKYVLLFWGAWIVFLATSWIIFQLWWDRKSRILSLSMSNDSFVTMPILAHFIQTSGEALGTAAGILGFFLGLGAVALGKKAANLSEEFLSDLPNTMGGLIALLGNTVSVIFICAGPLLGFFIIVIARFFAEQLRVLATLATNTMAGANSPNAAGTASSVSVLASQPPVTETSGTPMRCVCPKCGKNMTVPKAGRYYCPGCKSLLTVDATGKIVKN